MINAQVEINKAVVYGGVVCLLAVVADAAWDAYLRHLYLIANPQNIGVKFDSLGDFRWVISVIAIVMIFRGAWIKQADSIPLGLNPSKSISGIGVQGAPTSG